MRDVKVMEKGDFLRLRNVMLSYTLPKTALDRLRIQGLRVFVQGQNLYTWHNVQAWDPEVSTIVDSEGGNASIAGAQYPVMKSLTFGLNFNF